MRSTANSKPLNHQEEVESQRWKRFDFRYRLNNDMLSDTYKEYREIMYNYHMNGMDKFALNPKQSEAGFVVYHAV
jgi:hypothetical protein